MSNHWKTGYKVLKQRNKNLKSYILALGKDYSSIRYFTNKINVPKVGCCPLDVFDTLENAKNFANNNSTIIYRCKYIKSNKKYFHDLEGNELNLEYCPCGTKFADKVKLIRRITKKEIDECVVS